MLIFFTSDKLIPYNSDGSNKSGRFIKDVIDRTTPETSFIRDVFDVTARAVASKVSKRLNAKGGEPDFEGSDSESPIKEEPIKEKDNGRSRKDNSNGQRNGKARSTRSASSANRKKITRGHQTQPGSSCILFNSGISAGLTVNTRIVAVDYTPIYLSSGYLFKVTDVNIDSNTDFMKQLVNIIYPLVESIISNKIQRYAGRYFNSNDYANYILSITEALQVYYCIDSVLSYGSNISRDNINVGLEYLRSQFSSEAIVEFNLLRETICTCVCPPNLLNYIRFMCQNFRTSEAPHSPIIKLNIGGMFDSEWINPSDKITTMIRNCRSNIILNNKMISYLYQAFPEWLIGEPPQSANVACFNINFMTFWHNQNCCYLSTSPTNKGNFEYSIEVANMDAYTDYQIIQRDTEVDGLMFVSQTYNIPSDNKKLLTSYWGYWQPLATVTGKNILPGKPFDTFNIKRFDLDGEIRSCIDRVALGSSGIYNLIFYSGVTGSYVAERVKFGAYGFVKLQNVSVRMQNEAFNNSMRYLFMQ